MCHLRKSCKLNIKMHRFLMFDLLVCEKYVCYLNMYIHSHLNIYEYISMHSSKLFSLINSFIFEYIDSTSS